jgi:hypothetical protein
MKLRKVRWGAYGGTGFKIWARLLLGSDIFITPILVNSYQIREILSILTQTVSDIL